MTANDPKTPQATIDPRSRTCPHPDAECPSDQQLRDFALGKLPLAEADRIADTIDICAECETFVTQFESQSSDRFVDELLGSSGDARFRSESELQQAIRRVEAISASSADSIDETINLRSAAEVTESGTQLGSLIDSPQRFGEYVVTGTVGQGGMGVVYRGHHTRMKRDVAIKVLPAEALDDQDSADRFHREVEAAAKLLHPNIVTAFDAGQHGDAHYLIMELVDGRDLNSVLKEQGPLPVETAIDYIRQTARGLQYAHAQGIVHRDIKPANLLIDRNGTAKILDLGLASVADSSDSQDQLTKSGQVMGTIDYMAPEQAKDTHSATAQSDIYSLGCTLFRLLTGKPLYEGDTIVNKLLAHANNPIPDLTELRPDVPAVLNQAFCKMVAKNPAERQETMMMVIEELDTCEQETRQFPARSEITIDTGTTQGRRRPQTSHKRPPPGVAQPQAEAGRGSSARFRIASGVLFGGLALAAIILFLQMGNGTIRVEINDPSIEVTINENGYRIKGLEEDVEIKPGEHTLHVKRGEVEYDTGKFEVAKNDKVVIRVEYINGALRVVSNDRDLVPSETAPTIAETEADRKAVRFVLSLGGTLQIKQGVSPFTYANITDAIQIPEGPFQVSTIHLKNNQRLADADFSMFRELKGLNTIDTDNSNVGDNLLESLDGCTNLTLLHTTNCRNVTDAGVEHLKGLTKLVRLNLQKAQITDAGLKYLQNLNELGDLSLHGTNISDAGMHYLAGLIKLRSLDLSGTQVSRKGLATLDKCSALQTLSIYGTNVTDQDLEVLSIFPDLESLAIDSQALSLVGTQHLAKLKKFSYLNVNLGDGDSNWTGESLLTLPNLSRLIIGRNATDTNMQHVASLKRLTSLTVEWSSDVTDQGCEYLSALPSVEFLGIHGTSSAITDTGLERLASIKSLRDLRLGGTKVTPAGVAKCKAARPDCAIKVE